MCNLLNKPALEQPLDFGSSEADNSYCPDELIPYRESCNDLTMGYFDTNPCSMQEDARAVGECHGS